MAWAVDSTWNYAGVHGEVCWPYRQHKYTDGAFRSETDLLPLQPTYSHPLHLRVLRAYPSFPYPYGKDHQLELSSPVTTPDSYANGAGKFHKWYFFPISALCAYRGPTQIYIHAGTSPVLTGSKGTFGFYYQIPDVWLSSVSRWKERKHLALVLISGPRHIETLNWYGFESPQWCKSCFNSAVWKIKAISSEWQSLLGRGCQQSHTFIPLFENAGGGEGGTSACLFSKFIFNGKEVQLLSL